MLLLVDVTEQRLAEQRQRMLMRELDHRVKNNLVAILSLVEQSIESASSLQSFGAAFSGRIRALARTHEALASAKWQGVRIRDVIEMIVEPYAVEQQIITEGENVLLPSRVSSPLTMTLHELTTNAVKYGALSTREGRVRLRWETTRGSDGTRLTLDWVEEQGPPFEPTREGGMGLTLMEGFIRHELKGDLVFERVPAGLHCRLSIPLSEDVDEAAETGESS
jgi:two-component sensor histidine kinase